MYRTISFLLLLALLPISLLAEPRTWTKKDGSTVVGEFVKVEKGTLCLNQNGTTVLIPGQELSPADVEHVKVLIGTAEKGSAASASSAPAPETDWAKRAEQARAERARQVKEAQTKKTTAATSAPAPSAEESSGPSDEAAFLQKVAAGDAMRLQIGEGVFLDLVGFRMQGSVQKQFIGRFEVTQEQYQSVMGKNPSHFKGKNLPVDSVSWDEAKEFCGTMTILCESEIKGMHFDLPSEEVWEYCAKGGLGGTSIPDPGRFGWWSGNSGEKTHHVGGKDPNGYGLYDVLGNVWEWVDTVDGAKRVYRGSGWLSQKAPSASARLSQAKSFRHPGVGFRVVLTSSSK